MKKTAKILVPILLVLLILTSIVWYLFVYDRPFTRDTLLAQARFHDLHGNARISALFYDLAYDFSGHDENVAIELANQYKAHGNYTKAEFTLTSALSSKPTAELYTALCKTYVEQDKLLDAVSLLDKVTHPEIKAQLDAARPSAPICDFEPGYYSQYMDIHLFSSVDTIYYTSDREYPSINGAIVDGPISLPAGETTIHAIAVSPSGLVSPLTVLGYTITGVIEEVTFTDVAMEAAIRGVLGADADDTIYSNQLWNVTEFTVPVGVATYGDLSLMPYLQTLVIREQNIGSLSCLSSLSNLKTLDLTGSRFPADELYVVAGLPVLTDLTLSQCGLSTIEALAGAPSLSNLDLSSNTIRNLDVLSSIPTLQELHLEHNAVTDQYIPALGTLTNLESLNLSYNSITSLAPLSGCIKLNSLVADNNKLTNLTGVSDLSLLTHLSVDYNKLTDVSILSKCTALTNLSIANNSITDISALSTLTNMEIFDFSSNQVEALPNWPEGSALQTIDGSYNALTTIDSLKKMESIAYIYMDYNLLTSLDALAECYCLVQVNAFGNEIPDASALREHDIIVNYDPTFKK